jgi:two-component system cell cycle sensor histidine kinase/response regulator CckA
MALVATKALAGGAASWQQEFRCIDRYRRLHWFTQVASIETMGPGQWRVKTINTDITERKRAEEELRWKTALFEAQMDSSLDGMLVVNSAGRKIIQNQRMSEVWKIPRAIAESADDAEQVRFVMNRTKDPKAFGAKVAYLYAHPDEISRDEIELVDGTVLDRYSAPVKDKAGNYYGRIWTFRDITERRKLEEQFRQSQKMEAIGQLSGGVAHDFNNLLCVILGHTSLLETGVLTAEEHASALQQIAQAAERAANLTRQLLAFSRRQIMLTRPLDLNETTASMIKMLQRLIGEHIVLQTRYAPEAALVQADPGMIEQVLLNLAVNARDAMPDGGEIFIQTGLVHVETANLGAHPRGKVGQFIHLSVRDTGCGIAPEHLPRIFEPFFTTKEVGKGTGLGLATVFGIVEQHQGWIEVESEPGRGAAFHIYLPRLKEAAASERQPVHARVRGGTETILMVEDEPALRALTRNALERYGYRVLEAANGPLALKLWRENPAMIQLLLTDLVMPEGISGRDLAATLQADQPQLKVIYMSGYPGDVAGRGLTLREGGNFLQKPFSPIKLAELVRAVLDVR